MMSTQWIAGLAMGLTLVIGSTSMMAGDPSCGCTDCTSTVDSVFSETPELNLRSVVADPGTPSPLMVGDRFGGAMIGEMGSGAFAGLGGATALTGRVKNAELFSPLPRTRVFLNYSYFKNTDLGSFFTSARGLGVHRYVPGLELATPGGQASIEFRLPFAQTLEEDMLNAFHTGTVLGNFQFTPKFLLLQNDSSIVSAGLGIEVPTANDVDFAPGIAGFGSVSNKATHLMPFVSSLQTFDRLIVQSLLQFDFFAGNNTFDGISIAEEDWMYLSFALNYNLISNPDASLVTGVIPMIETHYNQTISRFNGHGTMLTQELGDITDVNLVVGSHFLIGESGVFTAGYTIPLTRDQGQFDGELRFAYNHFFDGGSFFRR